MHPACEHLMTIMSGQLADKPTRGQSSQRLENLQTGQLADSEFLKIMELLYFICTLNLTITLTPSNQYSIGLEGSV